MPALDVATIQALRADLALQISRYLSRRNLSLAEAARVLDISQATARKIVRGQITRLSLELLIRIAVRARIPIVMQFGTAPEEAGARLMSEHVTARVHLQDALVEVARQLTPEQRLNVMLELSQAAARARRSECA